TCRSLRKADTTFRGGRPFQKVWPAGPEDRGETSSTFPFNCRQDAAKIRAVIVLPRTNKGAKGEVFFVQLETTKLFRRFQVAHDERTQQMRCGDVQRHHLLVGVDGYHGARRAVCARCKVEAAARNQIRGED